jgi:hypothetical protein
VKLPVNQQRIVNLSLQSPEAFVDERWFDALGAADSHTVKSVERTGPDLENGGHLPIASRGRISVRLNGGRKVAALFIKVLELALRRSEPWFCVDVFRFLGDLSEQRFARKDERTLELNGAKMKLDAFIDG